MSGNEEGEDDGDETTTSTSIPLRTRATVHRQASRESVERLVRQRSEAWRRAHEQNAARVRKQTLI